MEVCSCGAALPAVDGPVHAYMLSTPSCWAAYGRLLAREYEDPARWRTHRYAVDAYAVQHPGVDGPQTRNSVGIHLSMMGMLFKRGWPLERARESMVAIAAKKKEYPWLEPPRVPAALTVLDVLRVEGAEAHMLAVERWARAVWDSWAEHHGMVSEWLGSAK